MIAGCLCKCGSPRTSHAWQKNPIAALKKHLGFYTSVFCKVRALITGQNRSSQGKNNFLIQATLGCSPSGEMDEEIDALVTTDHVFCPKPTKESRRLATDFAIDLRISREQLQRERPPGGGVARRIPLEST